MRRGRKRKNKHIECDYDQYFFKPRGKKLSELGVVTITAEELEAIRLVDTEHLSQSSAAEKMNTSSSTIQRLVESTREKVFKALIDGNAIEIEGRDNNV